MAVETEAVPTTQQDTPAARPEIPLPGAPAETDRSSARGARLIDWCEAHALFIAAVAAVVIISLASIPAHLSQDGWLALVAGRVVAHQGIPHHDYLTVMAHGVRWNDQQWLAQLLMYELQQIGGLALLTVLYVLLTSAAFAMAIAAARQLGAEERHITAMLPLGAFFYLATAVSIRTQGFVYPLFVASVWLLAAQMRHPSRRAYLLFPMLILWANLHGSATLGAGMGCLYGLCLLVEGFRKRGWRGLLDLRGLVFLIVSPLCLLVTPYGLSIISYYRATLFNPAFSKLVTEWQPVTAYAILAVPLLLLFVGTIWTLGRSGRRTPAFHQILLVVLGLAAIDAVRNITWFGLAVVILLPAAITGLRSQTQAAPRRRRLNITLATASIALAVLMVISTFAHPASWFERTYPTRIVPVIERITASDPNTKVFAHVRFADWLIWRDPALAGHVAYDTSFENLSNKQLATIHSLSELAPGQRDPLAPYSVLVLFPQDKAQNRILLSRTHSRVVLRSKRVILATKPAT